MKESEQLFSITIPEFIKKYGIGNALNKNFIIISDVAQSIEMLRFPLRVDAMLIGITLNGYIRMTINLREWTMTENSGIICLPENLLGVQSISPDYKGAIIGVSLSYLRNMNIDLKKIIPYYMSVCNHPLMQLSNDEMGIISRLYNLIISILMEEVIGKNRNEEVVANLLAALIFRMCDHFDRINQENRVLKTKSKEYYFVRFMDLLQRDFRHHRDIGYYSDQLVITPKYLSKLIKDISGLSAAQWIDEFTVAEASVLLKFSDKSIQQIAEYLDFPSQSFFSKYFKSHTGVSPSEWRGNNLKKLF
ncbi:helix-turn-helix domain-containing protein [Bacteroides clarus]|uniref:helix-turn-helix domain-containing protein n=1 Tax=Bacteroides clarus TaxID=626929 RepID=UPI00266515B8|nr:helix-turn-helix domain-containing protein [Bacteroides clarus]